MGASPSPHPSARRSGSEPITAEGSASLFAATLTWVGIAEVAVTPDAGTVQVTKFTVGVECGKIINPRQLDRCIKGGLVMGLSEALKEEVTFDKERVTSTTWSRYKILTMQETPEIKVVKSRATTKGSARAAKLRMRLGRRQSPLPFFDATACSHGGSHCPPPM